MESSTTTEQREPQAFIDPNERQKINALYLVFVFALIFIVYIEVNTIFNTALEIPTPPLFVHLSSAWLLISMLISNFFLRAGKRGTAVNIFGSSILIVGIAMNFPQAIMQENVNSSFFAYLFMLISFTAILGNKQSPIFYLLIGSVALFGFTQIAQDQFNTDPFWWITETLIFFASSVLLIFSGRATQASIQQSNQSLVEQESLNLQLINIQKNMDEIIIERTRTLEKRANYLEAAADVGHAATSIYNLEELLPQIADFISQRFNFYQVGIFLLDDLREFAVMRAASSGGGKRMLDRNHRLKVGEQGIVGFVSQTGEARIALDVGEDAVHFSNPELPLTRSEAALPLISGGQVIGAIDVQSEVANAFGDDDIEALRVLADQVSMAINNTMLFGQLQDSIESERRAYGELSRNAWKASLKRDDWGYRISNQNLIRISGNWTEDMQQAFSENQAIQTDSENQPTLSIPIRVSNIPVGIIRLKKPKNAIQWNEDESSLLATLSERLGEAVENSRLFERTQKQALQEQMYGEISNNIRESLDLDSVLQTAIQEIGDILDAKEVIIRMAPEE